MMHISRQYRNTVLSAIALACGLLAAAAAGQDPIIDEQAMVRLSGTLTIQQFNAQYGTTTLQAIESRKIYLVQLPPGANEDQWLTQLLANPPSALVWAELNYDGQDGEGRTGSFYVSSLQARNRYSDQYARQTIGLDGAHNVSTGVGATIAVLDTGLDVTHELFTGRVAPGGYNFIDQNTNIADVGDTLDNDQDGTIDESLGHGTFVSGLIHMVAPDAMILPVKVLDSDGHGHGFTFAAGVFHAIDMGADVINMSLGSTYSAQALEDALREARLRGVVVVGAAGNLGQELREFPAMKDDGIGVVATTATDLKADFSNYEAKADLSAPGTAIFSAIPMNAQGHTYARWAGTSMASPLVAGTAALLVSAHPEWSEDQSRHALVAATLKQSSVDIDPLNPNYAGMMGAGRLTAEGAMTFTGAAAIWPSEVLVSYGTHISGGLPEIMDDDGACVVARSSFGFTSAEPNVCEVRIRFNTSAQPATFELQTRARLDMQGGTQRLRFRNWNNGNWRTVSTQAIGTAWRTTSLENLNASGLVRAGDGRIELSVRQSVAIVFSSAGFRSYIDLAEVDLGLD